MHPVGKECLACTSSLRLCPNSLVPLGRKGVRNYTVYCFFANFLPTKSTFCANSFSPSEVSFLPSEVSFSSTILTTRAFFTPNRPHRIGPYPCHTNVPSRPSPPPGPPDPDPPPPKPGPPSYQPPPKPAPSPTAPLSHAAPVVPA